MVLVQDQDTTAAEAAPGAPAGALAEEAIRLSEDTTDSIASIGRVMVMGGSRVIPVLVVLFNSLLVIVLLWFAIRRTKSVPDQSCPGFTTASGSTTACTGDPAASLVASAGDATTSAIVVTLVHGTFARHAEWMRDGSPLCDALMARPGTALSRFCWTGENSHTARLEAGEQLAEHLRRLLEAFPEAAHFVVAHSHGGNVAMYAMKCESGNAEDSTERLKDRITGIVSLATPFVAVAPRALPTLVRTSVIFTIGLAIVSAHDSVFRGGSYGQFSFAFTLTSLIVPWLALAVLSAVRYRGPAFRFIDLVRLSIRKGDRSTRARMLSEELDRLQPVAEGPCRMLVVRPLGDEASMGLIVSQFSSWVQSRVLAGLELAQRFLLWGRRKEERPTRGHYRRRDRSLAARVLLGSLQLAALNATLFAFISIGSHERDMAMRMIGSVVRPGAGILMQGALPAILAILTLILAIYLAFSIASLIGLLGLILSAIPFGFDAVFWNHFASTTVESSPLGSARVEIHVASTRSGSGLAHSRIYGDPTVVSRVAEWIGQRTDRRGWLNG